MAKNWMRSLASMADLNLPSCSTKASWILALACSGLPSSSTAPDVANCLAFCGGRVATSTEIGQWTSSHQCPWFVNPFASPAACLFTR
eukprot:5824449-Alexandrium_andersonii.AAC.1